MQPGAHKSELAKKVPVSTYYFFVCSFHGLLMQLMAIFILVFCSGTNIEKPTKLAQSSKI